MKKFEYTIVEVKRLGLWKNYEVDTIELEKLLNEKGKNGWELVSVIDKTGFQTNTKFIVVLKREIQGL